EGHRRGADAVVLRRLDELGREARLAEEDPDSGHGRRPRAQMEGQRGVLWTTAESALDGAHRGFVDLAELRGPAELLLDHLDAGRGAPAEPFHVRGDGALVVVREQKSLVELPRLEGLRDGADAHQLTLGGRS